MTENYEKYVQMSVGEMVKLGKEEHDQCMNALTERNIKRDLGFTFEVVNELINQKAAEHGMPKDEVIRIMDIAIKTMTEGTIDNLPANSWTVYEG